MNKHLFIVAVSLLLKTATVEAAVTANDLIKVDQNLSSSCAEYYIYQNELYCSTKFLSDMKVDPNIHNYEKQHIFFDQRIWQPVWGKHTGNITTVEYIPAGDDLEQWRELVTSQFIVGMQQISAKQYYQGIAANLQQIAPAATVSIVEEAPNQIIFEYKVPTPESMQQDELQKVVKTPQGFYILHYVIRKPDMGDQKRAFWLKNLKNSSILN